MEREAVAMQLDPEKVCDVFDLGVVSGPLEAVTGGLSHRVWRLRTSRGTYAIKEMNRFWDEPMWLPRLEQAWGFEQRAMAAGVRMPVPIVDPRTGSAFAEIPSDDDHVFMVRAHEWIDAERVASSMPVDDAVARSVGTTLATLHQMDVTDFIPEVAPSKATRGAEAWSEIAGESKSHDLAWAGQLRGTLDAVVAAGELVRSASRSGMTYVLTHGDIDQKNLLRRGADVFVLDWDACCAMPARHELVRCAYDLAGWAVGAPDPRVRDVLLDSYVSAGRTFDVVRPDDFSSALVAHLDWIWFNLERAMGTHVQGPDDRALAMRLVPGELRQLRHMLDVVGCF